MVTALGWDCGPVGGNNVGKIIDGKKMQSTTREEKGGGGEVFSGGERTRTAVRGEGGQSPSLPVKEKLRRARI